MGFRGLGRWVAAGFLLLILNSAYIWAFASPTVFYMGNVLLHVLLGIVVAVGAVLLLRGRWREAPLEAAGALALAAGLGLFLTYAGATRDHNWALWGHVAAALAGLALLGPFVRRRAPGLARPFYAALAVLALLPLASHI